MLSVALIGNAPEAVTGGPRQVVLELVTCDIRPHCWSHLGDQGTHPSCHAKKGAWQRFSLLAEPGTQQK